MRLIQKIREFLGNKLEISMFEWIIIVAVAWIIGYLSNI